ncbi:transcriptional regulator [Sphaerisporangium rufum]|uniref:Transcriptional regulator n=1 Tax=Sphaerisporangium rufum TaxID=1381558 RepID=A0A919QY15_9ACTN|nr:winged helix-turn-helix domain-containing protein [Sphaerisporangium rufum]GII75353.1 transcriptional regulator [Sphaerisporangium rufum]
MLRIHFGFEDLARTRLAPGPDVMWELVLSLQLLQNRQGAVVFRGWRDHARRRLGGQAGPLATLAPDSAYFPDFLTPPVRGGHLEESLDTVLSTPRRRLREELGVLARAQRLPGWCARLADGDLETTHRLARAFRAYHAAVIEPYWPAVQAHVAADRARRSHAVVNEGAEALLSDLGPSMRWRSPVLEADYPVDRDLHLDGRGLLLVPAFFCWRTPVTLVDPGLPPVLIYPVSHEITSGPDEPDTGSAAPRTLHALIGGTRARVLGSIEDGCTTTELARRAGTSVPSASQHAATLRDAGLITTQRLGGQVLHSLAPLGDALLLGAARRAERI